jgi:mannose-6-phosphate isomerase
MSGTTRPWGQYIDLEETSTHHVKRMIIQPGHRLSLQYHNHRTEHCIPVAGRAIFTLDDKEVEVGPGDYVHIPVKTVHRAKCISPEPFEYIEVWTGAYFGEDDIVRLQDDYARPIN